MLLSFSPLETPTRSWRQFVERLVLNLVAPVAHGPTTGRPQTNPSCFPLQLQSPVAVTEESQEEDDATDFSAVPKNILAAEREVHQDLIDMVENYPDSAGTNSDCTDSTFSTSPSPY